MSLSRWLVQAIEVMVANNHQASLCVQKTRAIELMNILMKEIFMGTVQKTVLHAELFRSITRFYAAVMHLSGARTAVLSKEPRDFLTNFNSLLKVNWSMLERLDQVELFANGFKALRVLTDDEESLVKVSTKFPELLIDLYSIIMDNLDNMMVIKEAKGLINNIYKVNKKGVPVEFARLITGYDPEKNSAENILRNIYSELYHGQIPPN